MRIFSFTFMVFLGFAAGSVQAADQGPRHHAQGQYDAATSTYGVVASDDLDAIAERFGVTVAELKEGNKLGSNVIEAGQKLVIVVAPDRDRSGASNSLSLKNPLYVTRHDHGVYSVEGTPTDCVHVAITGLLEQEPDMVVSGINAGPNLGDDVIYSGTVAAAMEGRFLGLPAIALSQASFQPQHFATAARIAVWLVRRLQKRPLPPDTILNVNVPDRPWEALVGIQATRLGHRHKAEPVIKSVDPRGRPIYWIGPAGPEQEAGPGTDFHAVRAGYVSITPLHVDLTRHRAIDALSQWLNEDS